MPTPFTITSGPLSLTVDLEEITDSLDHDQRRELIGGLLFSDDDLFDEVAARLEGTSARWFSRDSETALALAIKRRGIEQIRRQVGLELAKVHRSISTLDDIARAAEESARTCEDPACHAFLRRLGSGWSNAAWEKARADAQADMLSLTAAAERLIVALAEPVTPTPADTPTPGVMYAETWPE